MDWINQHGVLIGLIVAGVAFVWRFEHRVSRVEGKVDAIVATMTALIGILGGSGKQMAKGAGNGPTRQN